MKIAIIGATGNVGTRIVDEALRRGHAVTAIARDPSKLGERAGLTPVAADANVPGALAPLLAGHDAIVSSLRFSGSQPDLLIDAVRRSGVKRYLVVGGAGSLEVAPGLQVLDTPDFPEQYKATAEGARQALQLLKQEKELDWTMLSPSAIIAPGQRTGKFRLGTDQLLIDQNGQSHISVEDYAAAMIDELERPAHSRQRFTAGY